MDNLTISYKQGNAPLNEIVDLFVEVNDLYRAACTEIPSQAMECVRLPFTQDRGFTVVQQPIRRDDEIVIMLKPSEQHNGNMTLDQYLRTPSGQPHDGVSGLRHRCGTTVRDEGERLIELYGGDNIAVLRGKYQAEFGAIGDQD